MKGTIKKITDRGFGFIVPEGEDKDLFFHSTGVKDGNFDSLKEGDEVTFEVVDTQKGPNATDVELV
jgi:CspA family cold shock protein